MDTKQVDTYEILGLQRHADGSITRKREITFSGDQTATSAAAYGGGGWPDPSSVITKDISINKSKNTWARIILPQQIGLEIPKLPLILFFHGGGFVLGGVDEPSFQDFYRALAVHAAAAVVSVGYRRPPEHRLPAAYDDCEEALSWIKDCPDDWISKYVDVSRCFVMGESAGGNIAYRVGLRAAARTEELRPLQIRGLILQEPFFGGKERSESELKSPNNEVVPLFVTDLMWEISLPAGADGRDHPFCNPTVEIRSNPGMFDRVKVLGWKILVTGCDGDPLVDRQIELANVLKEIGVEVKGRFVEGGRHGFEFVDPLKAKELCDMIKELIAS